MKRKLTATTITATHEQKWFRSAGRAPVQYTFRRHLGVTPVEYLRRVRLDRAHRDLQAADPAVDTVTAIAGRWGFTHAGRFSTAYKREFGTASSETLRN